MSVRTNRLVVLACTSVAMLLLAANQETGHEGHGHAPARNAANWTGPEKLHLYLCAFHVAKERPGFQLEAHHYCAPASEKIHQCTIYDARTGNPKLIGIEYIVGNDVYEKFPAEEKKYWHPHAYEITSGQLVAPDLPNMGDDIFPGLINTWGKTWHTWPDPSSEFPIGEPLLMWSANADGQIDKGMVDKRDAQFGIKTDEIRDRRKAWGYPIPNIPPPKDKNELGRRWTTEGADEPAKSK